MWSKMNFLMGQMKFIPVMHGKSLPDSFRLKSQMENRNIHIERYEKQAGSGQYMITNLMTYRTLLKEILAGAKDSDLGSLVQGIQDNDFKEDIKSIKYFNKKRVERTVDGRTESSSCMKGVPKQELTPFHYTADVVCGVIRSVLKNHNRILCTKNGKIFGILESKRKRDSGRSSHCTGK